jgi:Tfp pilus assembly protein PilF
VVAHESAAAPKPAGDERSARDAYERGNQRLLSGDAAGAVAAYEESVRSAPSSPSGYRGLGLAYEKEGKIAEAAGAFRHYLKLAPSSDDRELVARRLRHLLRRDGDQGK